MSEIHFGRALEFMSQPQDVEVLRGGNWVLGLMVGWRQEEGSSCRVMVRVTEEGAEKTAWADLHDVRLPEYRDCPPTQSLPLLPRLPPGRMEPMTWSEPDGEWNYQQSPRVSAGRATFHAPPEESGTGRHRELGGSGDSGEGHEDRTSGSRWGEAPASRGHEAGDALPSWWPSSTGPVAPPPEVEPTRLLTVPRPRYREAVAARHGGFTAY